MLSASRDKAVRLFGCVLPGWRSRSFWLRHRTRLFSQQYHSRYAISFRGWGPWGLGLRGQLEDKKSGQWPWPRKDLAVLAFALASKSWILVTCSECVCAMSFYYFVVSHCICQVSAQNLRLGCNLQSHVFVGGSSFFNSPKSPLFPGVTDRQQTTDHATKKCVGICGVACAARRISPEIQAFIWMIWLHL